MSIIKHIFHKITLLLAVVCIAHCGVITADNSEADENTETSPKIAKITIDKDENSTSTGHNIIMNADSDSAGYTRVKTKEKEEEKKSKKKPSKKTVSGLHSLGGFNKDGTKK